MLRPAKKSIKHALFSTRRIENLTDGVFAIAMTLLVLDLKIPIGAIITNQTDLINYLSQNGALFRNFLISFLMLAALWSIHMRQFEHITLVDRRVTALNSLRLLAVVFIPFTTSISGNYNNLPMARELLAINFLVIGIIAALQWLYICNHPEFSDSLTEADKAFGNRRNIIFVAVSFLVCLLVVQFSEYSYFAYFLMPIGMYLVAKDNSAVSAKNN